MCLIDGVIDTGPLYWQWSRVRTNTINIDIRHDPILDALCRLDSSRTV
jgi:hypothetical protein